MWLRKVGAAVAIVALMSLGALGCSDDAPAKHDAKAADGPGRLDTGGPRLDTGVKKDTFLWPDTGKPKQDVWPLPDGYAGTPFGCTVDADCFGLKCCSTPWGVRVCAQACH